MRSLTGQLIGLMLLALLLSQVLFYLINDNERDRTLQSVRRDEFLARADAVARLLASTDESVHPQVLRAAGTSLSRYWLTPAPPEDSVAWQASARQRLMRALPPIQATGDVIKEGDEEFVPNPRIADGDLAVSSKTRWQNLPGGGERQGRMLDLESWNGFGFAIPLKPGLWMHGVYAKPEAIKSPSRYYVSLAITALLLSFVAVLAARRVGRPLQRLTESAERIGRGEEIEPVPEEGAEDIRHTAAAFNRMQSRLRRFIEDRTRMMAAISHDLRTPITSLRLRAEFVTDLETKEKMIRTLDEMQVMTEATLAFSREEASVEASRTLDMDALLESLCDDLADLGWDVKFTDGDRIPWRCRPDALRRALRNVIENAVRYGARARVRLELSSDSLEIVVEDDGPGMAESDFERVFAPFVRLENSRNRDTGGVGLGLAIARTIIRSHGGDITLGNRPEGGLRVTISLPRD